jgi:1-aminocyclopropane-1-carboxylate deaminase
MRKKHLLSVFDLLPYHPTPLQEIIDHPVCIKAGVRLIVKREDLNHPAVSGNKWWKLKYNLDAALQHPHKTVLTFGGAFSNHIRATAAAAHELGLAAIGIIRGEETLPLNPTLQYAVDQGMHISYISRTAYREKATPQFIQTLHDQLGDFFLIPEGGSNRLAVRGCAEFAGNHLSKIGFDHLLLPVGTGGTMAGVVCGLKGRKYITGISVLRDGGFLRENVEKMVKDLTGTSFDNWSMLTGYHEGGYAKTSPRLVNLMEEMKRRYSLPLDQVYTGKLFLAAMNEIDSKSFSRGSTILLLHTGGLQGMPIH